MRDSIFVSTRPPSKVAVPGAHGSCRWPCRLRALPAASSKRASRGLAALLTLALAGCAAAPLRAKAHRVSGTEHALLPEGQAFSETGAASWYGADFHGKRTASGEPYDMYARTCAHKLLPLGTTVRITHLDNGLSSVARVNDRGPFVAGRIVDLSYTLACDLGLAEQGTARVLLEALAGPAAAAPPGRALGGPFTWQVGAFSARTTAETLADSLRAPFHEATVEECDRGDSILYRVRVGRYPTLEAAQTARYPLEALGFAPFLVRKD